VIETGLLPTKRAYSERHRLPTQPGKTGQTRRV
jgi:hypothetical protein